MECFGNFEEISQIETDRIRTTGRHQSDACSMEVVGSKLSIGLASSIQHSYLFG